MCDRVQSLHLIFKMNFLTAFIIVAIVPGSFNSNDAFDSLKTVPDMVVFEVGMLLDIFSHHP